MTYLAELQQGKIIPRSYSNIQHLRGSKMISDDDKLINEREGLWLTEKTRTHKDLVIVMEKADGCNVGVLRQGDKLIPLLRYGYDARTNPFDWIRAFADWVELNGKRFLNLLADGERVCGEWMIKTHTLEYKMKHEPFIVFDMIDKDGKRSTYESIRTRAKKEGFISAGLVHMGGAIEPETALRILGEGFRGIVEGKPEGVVYRYENENGFQFSAKYVSNPLLGTELFRQNSESGKMNRYK